MSFPKLYRKRLIPNECILLKDDKILLWTDELIITQWNVLKPRHDFTHGTSIYFLKQGYKISRFMTAKDELYYIYCDIIDAEFVSEDEFVVTDLLADVIVYPDNRIRVVDIGELGEALESGLLSVDQLKLALHRLDALLEKIYRGKLDVLLAPLNEIEKKQGHI